MRKQIPPKDIQIYAIMPSGWGVIKNATTAPHGYKWINNKQSRFGGKYSHALVVDERNQV